MNETYTCGLRGCAGITRRKHKTRYCAQKAIVWDRKGVGWCFYHNPENPHQFGGSKNLNRWPSRRIDRWP